MGISQTDSQTAVNAVRPSPLRRGEALLLRAGGAIASPVVLMYLAHLVLMYAAFLPNLADINHWDEAAYIYSGQTLMQGILPQVAGSPLASVLYGLLYLIFRASPFWLVIAAGVGRLIFLTLLWVSVYRVAKELSPLASPLAMAGMLFTAPFLPSFLAFPSDPLFVAFAGLALWQLVRYECRRQMRSLALASLFLGLAALARSDALLLLPAAAAWVAALHARELRRLLAPAVALVLPFAALVGGYILLAGLVTGNFSPGITERTYENFESGQEAVYSGSGELNPTIESRLEARRLYGTPEENGYSVMRAISRNPQAFWARLKAESMLLPDKLLRAYGQRISLLLFLLAARGVIELLRKRRFALLVLLLAWWSTLISGFVITIFRPGHLLFPFISLFALAAVGLSALLENILTRCEIAWSGAALIVLAAGLWLAGSPGVVFSILLFGLALIGAYLAARQWGISGGSAAAAWLVMLCVALVLHGNYPNFKVRALGASADEQALLFMAQNLPPKAYVMAGAPGVVWAAGMTYGGIGSTDVPVFQDASSLLKWMKNEDFDAVYVDPSLSAQYPRYWEYLSGLTGSELRVGYIGEGGNIQVLLLNH